jgi:hypothetical protein
MFGISFGSQTNRKSLPEPVIDFRESPPKSLHLLSQGEVTYFFEVPSYTLD